MSIKDIRNAHRLENGDIDCEVLFEGMSGWLPYTVTQDDSAGTAVQLREMLHSGRYEIAPFTATPEMLAEAREAMKTEISDWRDRQENAGFIFEFMGHRWDGGKASQARLSPVVAVADRLPEDFFWTDADNRDVRLSPEELIQLDAKMTAEMVLYGFKIHERQRRMKEEVDALTSLSAIRGYPVGMEGER